MAPLALALANGLIGGSASQTPLALPAVDCIWKITTDPRTNYSRVTYASAVNAARFGDATRVEIEAKEASACEGQTFWLYTRSGSISPYDSEGGVDWATFVAGIDPDEYAGFGGSQAALSPLSLSLENQEMHGHRPSFGTKWVWATPNTKDGSGGLSLTMGWNESAIMSSTSTATADADADAQDGREQIQPLSATIARHLRDQTRYAQTYRVHDTLRVGLYRHSMRLDQVLSMEQGDEVDEYTALVDMAVDQHALARWMLGRELGKVWFDFKGADLWFSLVFYPDSPARRGSVPLLPLGSLLADTYSM